MQQNQITEKSKLKPLNQYAKNKLTTEKLLQRKIKKRLISLRISNVLGNRIFKNNRNNHKLFFDNFLLLKNKKYLIVNNDYKDFITIDQFCKVVMEIIKHNIYGIYNVSLGKKVLVSELISWLDKNFYKRIKFIDVQTDSFTLSNKKLLSRIQIHLTKNQVKAFCKKLL